MHRRWQLILAAILSSPSVSFAEDCSKDEMANAKPHYTEAAKAFRIGELQKAADEFKGAYEACPSPIFLYNLGQTYRLLKQNEKALYLYKQYLSTSSADERRPDVQKWIDQLQTQIDDQRRLQEAPPPGPTTQHARPERTAITQAAPKIALTAVPTKPGKQPAYRRWWFWTAIGGVAAAGVAVGLGVALTRSSGYPPTPTTNGTFQF